MRVDFHTHTKMSDGSLSPADLVMRAKMQGVDMLSITDHDTLLAYSEPLPDSGVKLIPGIELSCVWAGVNIHVLGLNVDPENHAIRAAVARQDEAREQRAIRIGEKLAKKGVEGAYEEARGAVGYRRALGRPDFAAVLVGRGVVSTVQQAFDRYLGAGKIGDVKMFWPELPEAIAWIRESGGVAVMAHPLQYKLTRSKLRRLLLDFSEHGGRGMEVANGSQWTSEELRYLRSCCKDLGLQASIGSDFHAETPWSEVGCDASLVGDCVPVWHEWT